MSSEAITLAELIRQHQDRTGDSYSTIARRAGLSKAKIGQIAALSGQPHMPRVDTLEKVAKGLQVPLRVVQQAAMASAGVAPDDYADEARIDLIVSQLRELPPADLETVELFIASLYKRQRSTSAANG
ncbi:immunity repressor [Arthrobacter phage LittleTokyo]|nr:immunity repressor [Arthrobacter phage LittleTokyo]